MIDDVMVGGTHGIEMERDIVEQNPDAKIFFVSAKTGEGFDEWADWIRTEISEYQK